MIDLSAGYRVTKLCTLTVLVGATVSLSLSGCGTVQEGTEETTTGTTEIVAPVSATARLEYRIDSLMNENRRMTQQVEALATENRNLTGKNGELGAKIKELESTPPPVTIVPVEDVTTGYSRALAEYRKRNFSGAIKEFEALLNAHIREDLADNCHYWIGESYYGMGRYKDAINHFEMAMNYRESDKKDDAQLMVGNSYAAMGNRTAAKEAYSALLSAFPASMYVKKAQEKLARLK